MREYSSLKVMKKLKFVKIKCQCGHTNLVPVFKTFRVLDPIKCEKCRRIIAQTK